jgi:hypothetical protein
VEAAVKEGGASGNVAIFVGVILISPDRIDPLREKELIEHVCCFLRRNQILEYIDWTGDSDEISKR